LVHRAKSSPQEQESPEYESISILVAAWRLVEEGRLANIGGGRGEKAAGGREIEVFGNAYTRASSCPSLDHDLNHKPTLSRHVQALERQGLLGTGGRAFMPDSFVLPQERDKAIKAMVNTSQPRGDSCWLLKPAALSNTEGIRFLDRSDHDSLPRQGEEREGTPGWVLQRYISKPLLVKGHKFDVRVYVIVHRVSPLELYIYQDGLARYSSEPWEGGCEKGSVKEWRRSTHFTALYPQPKACSEIRTLQKLWNYLRGNHQADTEDIEKLWAQITRNIHRLFVGIHNRLLRQRPASLTAVHGTRRIGCDKIYGADILIDESFQPWILEVNESPDMGFYSQDDAAVKGGVMRGVVALVQHGHAKGTPPGLECLTRAAGYTLL